MMQVDPELFALWTVALVYLERGTEMSGSRRKTGRMLAFFVASVSALGTSTNASGAVVAVPSSAWSSSASFTLAEPQPLAIEVRVDIGGDGEALEDAIKTQLRARISKHPGFEFQPEAGTRLTVRVGWRGVSRADYTVTASAAGSKPLARAEAICELCNSAELLNMVDVQVTSALGQLPPIKADPPATAVEPKATQVPTPSPATPSKRIGPLGWGGLGVFVAGTGMLVAGGVLVSKGKEVVPMALDDERITTKDYRRAGRIWLGVGGTAFVGGAAMILADQLLRRRHRRDITLSPAWSRRMAGFSVRGSF